MAITKDYLNTSDLNTLATWMRTNLVPDYFAAVTYADSTITCTDADGNTLLTFGVGITAYKSATASVTMINVNPTFSYAYTCANGAILESTVPSSPSSAVNCTLITKTNNGKTAIVFSAGTAAAVYRSNIKRVAWGDAQPDTVFAFTQITANQTQLVPFCTDAAIDVPSYTPNAYYIPVCQNPSMGNGKLTIDGTTYLTNGYWAIKDE